MFTFLNHKSVLKKVLQEGAFFALPGAKQAGKGIELVKKLCI